MEWDVGCGCIRFRARDVDGDWWRQIGSSRLTPLRSARIAARRHRAAGCRVQLRATMDPFGSYFPAWILCGAVGIVAAVILRQILAVSSINDYVVPGRQFISILATLDLRADLARHDLPQPTQDAMRAHHQAPAAWAGRVMDARRRGSRRVGRRPAGTTDSIRSG